MCWDYRQQPDLDELDRHVSNITAGSRAIPRGAMLRIHRVDTGSDEYGVVITDEEWTQQQVNERWEAWRNAER